MIKDENGALVLDKLKSTGNVFMAVKNKDTEKQKEALIQAWITYAMMMGYEFEDIEFNQ